MRYATTIISGSIFLLTSLIVLTTVRLSRTMTADQAASFEFAYLYLGVLAVCSFGAGVIGLLEKQPIRAKLRADMRFYGFFGLCFLYVAALTWIGHYIPVTLACLAGAMILLGVKPVLAATVAAFFSTAIYTIFAVFLKVPMP